MPISLFAGQFLSQSLVKDAKLHRTTFESSQNYPNNQTRILSFPQPVEMDGYKLLLLNTSGTECLLSFILQASKNDNNRWVDIGAPRCRRTIDGVRLLRGPITIPRLHEGIASFDHRPTWPLTVYESGAQILTGLCLIVIAGCGAASCAQLARRVAMSSLDVLALWQGAAALGYLLVSGGGFPAAVHRRNAPLPRRAADARAPPRCLRALRAGLGRGRPPRCQRVPPPRRLHPPPGGPRPRCGGGGGRQRRPPGARAPRGAAGDRCRGARR